MEDFMRRHIVFVSLTVLFMLLVSGALFSDTQGWISNSLSFKINDSFSLKFTNESRFNEATYSDLYLRNWEGGIAYNLSKKLYVAALYKREDSRKTGYYLHENRFTLESGWKTKLAKKLDFDLRFKMEIRDYQYDKAKDHLNFRLRFRVKSELTIGQLTVNPFIAIEPFADTIDDTVNRYRFYAGFVFPLSKNVGIVINYLQQGTKDKETLYIANSGIELKF